MISVSTAIRILFTLLFAMVLAACNGPDAPVSTWQQVGVVKDGVITRVYVVNSHSGLVCEHEHYDSSTQPGSRNSLVNCSLPDALNK